MANMRVTYYAMRRLQVGDQFREPGDLVPEVADWPYLSHYINEAKVAPVLVVTLPQEVQDMLSEWEAAQSSVEAEGGPEKESEAVTPVEEETPVVVPEEVSEASQTVKTATSGRKGR